MNIYDSIKSPFEDDETLKKIIEIYSNIDGPIVDGSTLYKPLLIDYDNDIDEKAYMEKFDEYIFWPITEDLFEKQKNTDMNNKDVYLKHKSYRELYEYVGRREGQLTDEQKGYLRKYDFALLANQKEIQDKYRKLICEKINKGKEFLKERNLKKQIEDAHTFQRDGLMGFHFNSHKNDSTEKTESSDIKFYINAGEDTYKVAKLFLDKCREAKLDSYYFKVADPMSRNENEIGRTDRLCIYSTMEHSGKFINFINEIKEQNPDIDFIAPPLNTGVINGVIGVGQDQGKNSYNEKMGDIISKVLNNICKEHNIKHQDLIKAINQDPKRLDVIRENLYNEAKNNNMSSKVCVSNEVAEKLKMQEISDITKIVEQETELPRTSTSVRKGPIQVYDEKGNIITHEFINPSLLDKKITLPNGNQMTARQYIQENFAPYIPESGTFKLKNGVEISAKQFIEEQVIFNIENYNGDIDALMQDTLAETDEPPQKDGWTVPTHGQEKGVSIESFKKSLESKRNETKLGLSDIQNTQSTIKNIQHNRNAQKGKDNGQSR